MVLEGPDGQECDVQLWGSIDRLEFRQGWKKFLDFHGLEMGDFLVFKYISKSYFRIQIFDRTACEKNLNARHFMNTNVDTDTSPSDKVGRSSRPMGTKLANNMVYDEKDDGFGFKAGI
ncbi:hypothetical protein SUGI_0774400 [Cryptomeria japonica]|nr:hypothetical protein SUGI_0774400 [Cryptomeria japonica]